MNSSVIITALYENFHWLKFQTCGKTSSIHLRRIPFRASVVCRYEVPQREGFSLPLLSVMVLHEGQAAACVLSGKQTVVEVVYSTHGF